MSRRNVQCLQTVSSARGVRDSFGEISLEKRRSCAHVVMITTTEDVQLYFPDANGGTANKVQFRFGEVNLLIN